MGRDGAPRLKLTVITDDASGSRLCRGYGDPLMPPAKSTAVFCEDACRSRHWRRIRRARARTEAVKAGVSAATRYDKLACRYEATVLVSMLDDWLRSVLG
ncbi:hypothetical protein [Streptomyces spiralis]|nr:hypothetical protein [Streptomyces spiralis]